MGYNEYRCVFFIKTRFKAMLVREDADANRLYG